MKWHIRKILLRLLSLLTRWLWRLLVFIIIVTAVIVSAGRELAPLLSDHKPWLESRLSASIGEVVTIERVDAHWEGLVPELLVKHLVLGDAVHIDSALMRVDLLASARSLSPVFETLDIKTAAVVIPIGATDTAFDFRSYLEFFLGSADIRVRNLDVVLQQNPENKLSLHVDEFKVNNDRGMHWLNGAVTINRQTFVDKKDPIKVALKFYGDADDVFRGYGRAHIDFGDEKNLSHLLQFLQQLPTSQMLDRISSMDHLKGQVWLSWHDERIDWVSQTSLQGLTYVEPAAPAARNNNNAPASKPYVIDFDGQLAGYVLTNDMQVHEFFAHSTSAQSLSINQRPYPLPVVAVQYTDDAAADNFFSANAKQRRCQIYLPILDLALVAQYLDLLPSGELRLALKTLNPTGQLNHVLLTLPLPAQVNTPAAPFQIQTQLKQVSVSAWQGAPALGLVDGYLQASATDGFIDVDARDGFSMFFRTLYHRPMQYGSARGRVSWNIHPVNKHIYVGSSDLEFHAADGDLHGSFWLDLPPAHSALAAELYLQAGLENSQVKYRNKYLPYTLDAGLRDWLANSLKAGDMDESGFIYRGSLSANDAQNQTTLFYSKVKNGRLQFDPAWPVLDDMNGLVLVNNSTVHADIKSGQFLESRFSDASADLTPSSNGKAHFLTLQAEASGPGQDVLNVMRNTPLRQTFGNVFDGWQLDGTTSGRLKLGLHIGAAEELEYQELDWQLKNNDLLVGKINLPMTQMSGDVHYSSTTGLQAEQLNARLWDREQMITITPVSDGDGLPDISLAMSGKIDSDAVARWTHLPFVHFLKGDISMNGVLTVPLDKNPEPAADALLVMQSDMKGVVIDLPEPFKKTANKSLPSELRVELWKDKQLYKMKYGDLMAATVEQPTTGPLKGAVMVNNQDEQSEILPDHLRIRTKMNQVALTEWIPVLDRYKDFSKADLQASPNTSPNAAETPAASGAYPVFDIGVTELSIGSMKLDDVKLLVNYQQDGTNGNYWNIGFENATMAGRYHFFDDENKLPEVDFDVVRLGDEDKADAAAEDSEEDDATRVDPLADVIPQDLPAMRVHARKLWLQGNDVGDWQFTVNPDEQGVVLENLYVSTPGLSIRGLEKDQGATVRWTRTGDNINTDVVSRINLSKQQGAQNLFGVERIIEAEKTEFRGTMKWQGSPAMLSFRRLQGELSFVSEKGRFLNSTASTDIMRVINVFNFSTWARRLKLDFTDLYQSGVSFDKVTAHAYLDRGKLTLEKPLVMVGPSGRFELKGAIDSVRNQIDANLIVTIPVNSNATWIAALAAGLPVAAGVWAVSKVFGDQIDKLSSVNYAISGTLDEPSVKFIGLLPELSTKNKAGKSTSNVPQPPKLLQRSQAPVQEPAPAPEPWSILP